MNQSACDPVVSVCIATWRRPELLRRLVLALLDQVDAPPYEIIIVDNDAEESGKQRIDDLLTAHAQRLRYSVERRRNIAHARNHSLSMAQGQWIAFIDDDEVPGPRWLSAMYSTARACKADGVFAPVVGELSEHTAGWLIKGGFFNHVRHETGSTMPRGELRTSNTLIRADLLSGRQGPFDPAFGLSGGEDSRLFRELAQNGAVFVWCDEDDAVVRESIPADRARIGWLLKRAFRGGQTYARVERILNPGTGFKLTLLGKAVMFLPVALLLAILTLPAGWHYSFKWQRKCAAQLGKLASFTPYTFLEYE